VKTLQVGRLRAHVLNDGTFPFPAGYFFHNVAQATWREHVRADAPG
jgi:hypothetical protein